MSEQVRGAIFNVLGDIAGLSFLDAFAGSGAVGFEALSRGAQMVTFIESSNAAQRVIAQTIALLRVGRQAKLIKTTISNWLDSSDQRFAIIVADPPYHDLQLPTINRLIDCLQPTGTLVLSWPGNQDLPTLTSCQLVQQRSYGDAQLGYYQFIS